MGGEPPTVAAGHERSRPAVPPTLLVVASMLSVQFGGALAATLLPMIGVAGSVTFRLVVAAIIMLIVARPTLRGHSPGAWVTVAAFGVALGVMNTSFYASLARLPIGVSVTVEFIGPLLLAAALSRRPRDLVLVAVAAAGVALISGIGPTATADLDPLGVALALVAGAAWAAYIVLSARSGARFPGVQGLAIAMTVAAVLVLPFGVATAGPQMLWPDVVWRGVGIAVLSSVLPYSLELVALRHMSAHVFGILLSLEPAIAALAGLVVLGQRLDPVQIVGMAAVVLASASVTQRTNEAPPEP